MIFNINYDEKTFITRINASLIPAKRKNTKVTSYVESLNDSFAEFTPPWRYKTASILFINRYSEDIPETRYIDNDNLSIKLITDVLQRHILLSDSSALISTTCVSEKSEDGSSYSKIVILPNKVTEEGFTKMLVQGDGFYEHNQEFQSILYFKNSN